MIRRPIMTRHIWKTCSGMCIYRYQNSLAVCNVIIQKTPLVLIFIIIHAMSKGVMLCVPSYISGFGFDHSSHIWKTKNSSNFLIS